jgi:cupin superfamily acireductone dioxygenase involved in methionine salvage
MKKPNSIENLEKIYFDKDTCIWKTKLNLKNLKIQLLEECHKIISLNKDIITHDGFAYFVKFLDDIPSPNPKENWFRSKTKKIKKIRNLDIVTQFGIDKCNEICKSENKNWNIINLDAWINVIRAKNPVQDEFKSDELKNICKYHNHADINKKRESFVPQYTYVYYIQMPDIMNEDDGVLYFKGNDEKEYSIRPEEDDLIIMPGNMAHTPKNAPNSTIDRIVFAGNVSFEMVKTEKSLF